MSSFAMKLYITDRFLHGYKLTDLQYDKINVFLKQKIHSCKKKKPLKKLLKQDIGEYNILTAAFYLESAHWYWEKFYPDQEALTLTKFYKLL